MRNLLKNEVRLSTYRCLLALLALTRSQADFSNSEVLFDGFYVSTDDIFDDAKWSQAVYFEEVGFDQDVCASPATRPKAQLTHEVVFRRRRKGVSDLVPVRFQWTGH